MVGQTHRGAGGTGSSDIALAKSESYSTLTWWVLNRWIGNKQLRFDTVACEHCRQSTVSLWSGWILCIGTVDKTLQTRLFIWASVRSELFIHNQTVQNSPSQDTVAP
jgi:hypothetical protein